MAVQRGGTQTIWTPVAHSPIFPRIGNVLCGFSSKASGKGVKPTGPSKEEQPPQAFSVKEGKQVLFLSEKVLEKSRLYRKLLEDNSNV